MYRLRSVFLVLGLALLIVASSLGQEKKADDTKSKAGMPSGWKDLNLTATQKQQVYKIHAEYKTKIDDLEKKVKELKTEEYAEKVKVLNDDQKKKLKDTIVPDDKPSGGKSIEGKFVKYSNDKLIIKTADDKDHEFAIKDIKPLIDGKEGKWDNVREGAKLTVTEKDGKATKVEVKNP